jgi:hypothetical protein
MLAIADLLQKLDEHARPPNGVTALGVCRNTAFFFPKAISFLDPLFCSSVDCLFKPDFNLTD